MIGFTQALDIIIQCIDVWHFIILIVTLQLDSKDTNLPKYHFDMKRSEIHDYYTTDTELNHNISLNSHMCYIVMGYIDFDFNPSLRLIRHEKRIL